MNNLEFRYFDPLGKFFNYSSQFDWPDNFSKLEKFFSMASRFSEGVVQQYTGLTDSTGKKIFEGDIVGYGTRKWLVVWNDGGFFEIKDGEYLWEVCDKMTILGNTFENPELLK